MTAPTDWSDTPSDPGNLLNAAKLNALGAVVNGKVSTAATSTASMAFVVDEDNMASNSATKVPTQQSVKAYVDSVDPGLATTPRMLVYSSGWPDRPNDDRPCIFSGGDTDTNAPTDPHLRVGDIWIPAT